MERLRSQNRQIYQAVINLLSHAGGSLFWQLKGAWIFHLYNILTPAGCDTRQFPVGVSPCTPCVTTSLNLGVRCHLQPNPTGVDLDLWPMTFATPTLLTQPLPSPLVGWKWRAHYQVSFITPSQTLTALIYGDCCTCVHSVGVEMCISIWLCWSCKFYNSSLVVFVRRFCHFHHFCCSPCMEIHTHTF